MVRIAGYEMQEVGISAGLRVLKRRWSQMLNIGNYSFTKTRLLAVITLVLAVMIWMQVSLAGLPLVPIALAVVAIALLW